MPEWETIPSRIYDVEQYQQGVTMVNGKPFEVHGEVDTNRWLVEWEDAQ